jgi:endonuclease/exonuclease/phosphatase family metal-dependent hydrolase
MEIDSINSSTDYFDGYENNIFGFGTLPHIASSPSHSIDLSELITEPTHRASLRRLKFELAQPAKLQSKGTYVGELHEKWQFPSDHLPIGMTLHGIHIASWNILDAAYMNWVTEKDSQGLDGSMLSDEHIYIGETALTVRDQHVADLVLEMIHHPTHPRSVISLQECSVAFIEYLKPKLPSEFQVIFHHGNAVLFDQSRFKIIEAKEVGGIFSQSPSRTFQDVFLEQVDTNQALRILNAHLPGDPEGPGRYEFAKYLLENLDFKGTMIAMGDMNFNEIEMLGAFGTNSPFSVYSPYCTNVSIKTAPQALYSKAIDHFISPNREIELNSPENLMRDLDKIVGLLND